MAQPLDPDAMLRVELVREMTWGPDDVILYHLGVGAGSSPTDSNELRYTYEEDLHVLPTFSVVPALPALMDIFDVREFGVDRAMTLHGIHDLELAGPVPVAASARTTVRVVDVLDKGSAAVVVLEATTCLSGTDTVLFMNRLAIFVRDAGGFGGSRGNARVTRVLDRPPDVVAECRTLPQQALLFRLSGDKNPLHADPDQARRVGFDRPILHGLCTYGIACKAVVDHLLGGDAGRVRTFGARFTGVVFPGETLVVEMWRDEEQLACSVSVRERDTVVLSDVTLTLA